ncbi:hypothetical protein AAFF_G00283370 [Aldrovandia affinis]|uniref:Uncharacterized protein n=1 Tax=Aldrovandia affinis TaxID=143900 RepID=A0AAD7TA11_9TELE|nr:hypothetical protein AAFF_G00283370 [Aldrovandia affinis]
MRIRTRRCLLMTEPSTASVCVSLRWALLPPSKFHSVPRPRSAGVSTLACDQQVTAFTSGTRRRRAPLRSKPLFSREDATMRRIPHNVSPSSVKPARCRRSQCLGRGNPAGGFKGAAASRRTAPAFSQPLLPFGGERLPPPPPVCPHQTEPNARSESQGSWKAAQARRHISGCGARKRLMSCMANGRPLLVKRRETPI